MKKIKHILMLFLFIGLNMHGQTNNKTKIENENAFDFWVGNWEASWYGKDSTKIIGTNRILKILDGKAIQENFEDPSMKFKGTSISVYDPRGNEWHQAWADNQGTFYNFVGEIFEDKRIFKTVEKNKNGILWRMVFSEIEENSFVWTWQGTKDDGKSWDTFWKIFYKRID